MSLFGKWYSVLLAIIVMIAALTGCSPDQGMQDEEKESHYMEGKGLVNAMNYDGAIKAFEESLEANPHSAAAHYQLAMLFENQESDPAAAIYHYQQYLKFDPKSENLEIIQQHIASCKQQLAADVLQLPSAPAAQQQLEKLTEENRRLHDQLSQWQAYYAAQVAAAKSNSPVTPYRNLPTQGSQGNTTPTPATSVTPDDVTPQTGNTGLVNPNVTTGGTTIGTAGTTVANGNSTRRSTVPATSNPRPPTKPRTHTVASGETLASIARKQGVTLSSLEAANPTVNPKKLKAGQVINLPVQ